MNNAAGENPNPSSPENNANPLPIEAPGFSREQLDARASATTQVLAEILQQDEESRHITHWGINE